MADGIYFDFSELDKLTADLVKLTVLAPVKVRQAVEISARKVKDGWADKLKGEPLVPHGARSITYDITADAHAMVIGAEVGSETGRPQAPIVTVIEFGAPGNNTAPRGYGHRALQENQKDFIKGLEIATEIDL